MIINNSKVDNVIKNNSKIKNKGKRMVLAFVFGGLIGMISYLFYILYKDVFKIENQLSLTLTSGTIVLISFILTCFGVFDKLVNFCRCGLIVPITGFAHSMTSSAIEFKREGYVTGLGANIFKLAGTVILYGIVSAYIFGIIRYFVLGGV